jgi:hypothetical protein
MTKTLRLLLATTAVAAVALGGAARALACGNSTGYSYAGLGAPSHAYGISATITTLDAFDVLNGHVAGWVGVGGPGQGPSGTNEWLQIGFSGFPGITGSDIYYEVAEPNRFPTYHQVADALPVGTVAKVTVLEMHNRPDFWRVWLNHKAVSPPIRLPGLEPDRHGRELGRRDGRHLQHLPLPLPPRLDRPGFGRWLASDERRLPDHQRDHPDPAQPRVGSVFRGGRPAGLPAPQRYFLIQIGVPSGA